LFLTFEVYKKSSMAFAFVMKWSKKKRFWLSIAGNLFWPEARNSD